ncbi:MAG: tetratricopeptide repeat protein, partial [Bacteroidetes bacterium]|nr:tetratricopeptide repeat protein [Bacteroidota bacterium]
LAAVVILQSQNIVDSLKTKLENTHEINEKIDIYLQLSKQYEDIDITKAFDCADKAMLLAEKTNAKSYLGLIYTYLGVYSILQDSIENGEAYFNKAKLYLLNNDNPKELISVFLSIGNRYVEKDNYAEAMKYYLKGIDLSKKAGLKQKLPNLYNNLGIVYLNTNNTEKALNLYSKALELFKEQKDTMNIAGTTTNIGSIYIQLGQNEIAETYYRSGYELFKEFGSFEGMAHSQLKLGLLDLLKHEYDSAEQHFVESIKIQKELVITYSGSKSFFLAETYINLGIAYLNLNKFDDARENLLDGYNIARNTNQYRLIALASQHLSQYFQNIENFESSLNYFQIFKQYSDSNFNEESVIRLTQVEMQNEFKIKLKEEELDRKIEVQNEKRKNLIYIIISVGLFLLLTIVGLLLKLEKTGKRKAELEKSNLSVKLEHTNKELTTYVMYLLRKNEFIISIAEKLKVARLDAKTENKKIMTELIKELESNSTVVSWEEFEVRFQQVYTGFYKKLNNDYPDLSPNELRLCAFFRLNMTTKEIAAITYQSINSITVARYRLRKKLGITSDENLIAFLTKM